MAVVVTAEICAGFSEPISAATWAALSART
jgi:hypothetical protein